MKKLFSLFVLLFSSLAISWGQTIYSDSVFLNNGSIICGWMMNKTTKGDVWVKTSDGKTIKIKNNEIAKIKADVNVSNIDEITPELKPIDNNHWGIRAGAVFSRCSYDAKFGSGAHLGGILEQSLDKQQKWFLQTGVDFQFRAEMNTEGDKKKNDYIEEKINTLHLEIPLMFSYKIPLKNITIYPSFGVAYSLGLCGKYHYYSIDKYYSDVYEQKYSKYVFYNPNRDDSDYEDYDEYDNDGNYGVIGSLDLLIRIWLVKFGVNAEIKDFYVGFEAFTNIYNLIPIDNYRAVDWHERQLIFNGLKVSVGYNF